MKKHTSLLLFPIALLSTWIQAAAQDADDIDLSDVVIVENVEPVVDEESSDSASVVEITESEATSIDVEAPVIPVATEPLPDEMEIVLEIPGQESQALGEATIESEGKITVDFPDEDIRTILRNVADLFELNLVIPDTLQGRTSIKLRGITWRQVFEVVLDPFDYTYVEDRNIIVIKSIEELTTEPVDTRVFVAGFANATELQGSIAPLVDAAVGGQIKVDVRSNALVITERPSRMNKIQEIIERLDKPTAQVMIESKFVEVINSDTKDLGVNWAFLGADQGLGLSAGPFQRRWDRERDSTGTGTSDITSGTSSSTSSSTTETSGFPAPPTLVESTSSSAGTSGSTSLGESLSSIASTSRLDTAVFSATEIGVVLTALSQNNDSKLVSNPTVITMNNEEATIDIITEEERIEFEFNEETGTSRASGVGEPLVFGTKIKVKPQVSAAGFINLQITPEVSNKLRERPSDLGTLTDISKRTATTKVMIKDGYTIAIGGLTENTETRGGSKVPLLGDLPGVGRLFKNKSDNIIQKNLVIFITAKTLNPDGSTYRDTVDPRKLDDMGLMPSEIPGYTIPQEELDLIQRFEDIRSESEALKSIEELKARIKEIEDARKKAEEELSEQEG
ncbi:MAG: type II secretion system protein GspD [Opitutales bacterium]